MNIGNIRSNNDQSGLREYEIDLIRYSDKISDGSEIDINKNITTIQAWNSLRLLKKLR